MEGIANILKPPGMTSHDVISFLRRVTGEKKIGHCGTLDPQAAGVLPVCFGQATKLADYLSGGEKSYFCEMKTGYETDTQDAWGAVTAVYPALAGYQKASALPIAETLRSFEGEILQEVPAYSAVKREGRSLHQYAREGRARTGIMRKVRIGSVRLMAAEAGIIRFVVDCGAGTYVRMLCRDIGRKLGCGGVMSFLLRLRVGPLGIEDSITLEEFAQGKDDPALPYSRFLDPKERALAHLPAFVVTPREAERLRHGQSVWVQRTKPMEAQRCKAWAADGAGRLVALGFAEPGQIGAEGAGDGAKAAKAARAALAGCAGSQSGRALFKPDRVFGAVR